MALSKVMLSVLITNELQLFVIQIIFCNLAPNGYIKFILLFHFENIHKSFKTIAASKYYTKVQNLYVYFDALILHLLYLYKLCFLRLSRKFFIIFQWKHFHILIHALSCS